MYNLDVLGNDNFFVGEESWLVHNDDSVVTSKEFSGALKEAMSWLEQRGFKAEKEIANRFPVGERGTKVIGMSTADGKIGYRIEWDSKKSAYINVFAGREKGPHFTFPGDKKSVFKLTARMFGCQ